MHQVSSNKAVVIFYLDKNQLHEGRLETEIFETETA